MTEDKKADQFEILLDKVPEDLKPYIESFPRNLEDVTAQILTQLNFFFAENNFEFPKLITKTMELVEEIRKLKPYEKKIVAVRCSVEFLYSYNKLNDKDTENLAITIPSSIESIIQLSKEKKLNRKVKSSQIVDKVVVVTKSFEQLVEYIRNEDYTIGDIMKNIFHIVTKLMYIVGGYSTLASKDKKDVVIQVITKLVSEYVHVATGGMIPPEFINIVLSVLPLIIDTFVDIVKGKYNINNLKKCCAPFICC